MRDIIDRLARLAARREQEGMYTDQSIALEAAEAIQEMLEVAEGFVNQACIVSWAVPDKAEIGRYSGKGGDTMRGHLLSAKDRAQAVINTYSK